VDALQPEDPQRVGIYLLLHRLGTGGMGRVYLGQSPAGQMVAVKLIRAELADNPNFRRRFAQEVEAAKRVSGIFTAPVVDADPEGPQPWLVTAYVAGPSLADAVNDYGALPLDAVRMLAAGLAEGLGAVHAAGIVHRDLKPSNVLLASDGPRIIDFGISRARQSAWLTGDAKVIGSPAFMSPEQAEGRRVSPATDIFSLGGVLAFAASARPPFGTGSTATLLHRVVYSTASLGHVPVELRPLIERCLAKDPAARPTTDQLLAELGRAQLAKGWLSRHIHHSQAAGHAAAADGERTPAGGPGQYDVASDRTRPTGHAWVWRGRTGLISWLSAAVVAAGAASAFGIAAAGHHSIAHPTANSLPAPRPDIRKHIEMAAPPSPGAVVRAYFSAINARDWGKVWRIGGDHMGLSYGSMVAGYTDTTRDVVDITRVSGDHVTVSIRAYEVGGAIQVFKVEYTVRNGLITSGKVLATYSWPADAVTPASAPKSPPAAPRPPCRHRAWRSYHLSRPEPCGQPSMAPAIDA
jgi:Protein kinase domain